MLVLVQRLLAIKAGRKHAVKTQIAERVLQPMMDRGTMSERQYKSAENMQKEIAVWSTVSM